MLRVDSEFGRSSTRSSSTHPSCTLASPPLHVSSMEVVLPEVTMPGAPEGGMGVGAGLCTTEPPLADATSMISRGCSCGLAVLP